MHTHVPEHLPTIDGVALGRSLGHGAASRVFSGRLQATGLEVAVKIIRTGLSPGAHVAERAVQEARLCWSINHPHVVRVFDHGQTSDGMPYLLMELLSGETLQHLIERAGTLAPNAVVSLGRQLARGLAAIHARGAVHRDIKPDNLFLCPSAPPPGRLKILDLGVAKLAAEDPDRRVMTQSGLVLGTPGYIAPEQARGAPIDARCDLFAAGATLFTALFGQPPFDAPTPIESIVLAGTATAPPTIPDGLSTDLAVLLSDLLEPNVERRVPNAVALLERLDAIAGRPPAGFNRTTVMLGAETVPLGDLHLPTLGDVSGHRRFRMHVLRALATLFPPGRLPTSLREHLGAIDRLNDERGRQAEAAKTARAAADALARALSASGQRLQDAAARLDESYGAARSEYVRATTRLMALAARIGDVDHGYVEAYQRAESSQRAAASRAESTGTTLLLNALYDAPVQQVLAEMDAAQRRRAELLAEQEAVRRGLLEHHRVVTGLAARRLENKRATLAVEIERQTELARLDEVAGAAEDTLLHLDRAVEHAYLTLGGAIQRQAAAQ